MVDTSKYGVTSHLEFKQALAIRGVIARSFATKQSQFKNVVAQFIGQLCLMNQATTKSGARSSGFWSFDIV